MNNLDIDELVEFINNRGSKKEDLQKACTNSKKSSSTPKGVQ